MQFDFAFPVPTRAVRTTAHHSKLLAFAVALLTMTPISHAQDTPRPARPTPPTTARPENAQSAEDQVFSGPQIGELLPELPIRLALGAQAGSDFDPVTTAAAKPVLLIFVHDINRQSISMTRVLSGYCASRADTGLQTSVIFLADDLPAADAQIQRMQHALTPDIPTGISPDGREGPGTWGLNRNVTLTIIIGQAGKATGNFALVQPSLQADLPRILKSLVAEIGGEVPPLEKLPGMPKMESRPAAGSTAPPDMRALLTPVIRRDAPDQDVQLAAEKVEARAETDPAVRAELARISTTIVNSGKLSNYGTPRAQEYLRKWAQKYGANKSATPAKTSE